MQNWKQLENYSLSDLDIHKIFGAHINIIPYSAFSKVSDIVELLSIKPVIIFFEEDKQGNSVIGHWEGLKMVDKSIQFFDSYGIAPDKCREWLSYNKLVQLKQEKPFLTPLLLKAKKKGYDVFWNPVQFQSYKKDVATCGDHSSCFILNGDLRDGKYFDFMEGLLRTYNAKTYDQAVSMYIYKNFGV